MGSGSALTDVPEVGMNLKTRQPAYKPGSVHALSDAVRPFLWTGVRTPVHATYPTALARETG